MRRLALSVAALALVAAVPAGAEEVHWASYAVASTQYSSIHTDQLVADLSSPVSPVENAVGTLLFAAVDPFIGPVLCTIFSGSPCVPEDPAAFAAEVAEAVAALPGTAAGIVGALPGQLLAAIEAYPDKLAGAPDKLNETTYGNWSAMQATGAPDTYPSCGDIFTAWAPRPSGSDPEFLAVFYDPPVPDATRVDIYETNIGGFVTSVEVILATGETTPVFVGPDTTPCPGILSIPLSGVGTVAGVIINTQVNGWEEIDAVGVVS